MRLSLHVLTPGRWLGRQIPVPAMPFLIGRDAHCQLRPASSKVWPRQCAILLRAGMPVLHDLHRGGTAVNGREPQPDQVLHDHDVLQVGPLSFAVCLEDTPPQPRPWAVGRHDIPKRSVEDIAAEILLEAPSEAMTATAPVSENAPKLDPPTEDSQAVPAPPAPLEEPSVVAGRLLDRYLHSKFRMPFAARV